MREREGGPGYTEHEEEEEEGGKQGGSEGRSQARQPLLEFHTWFLLWWKSALNVTTSLHASFTLLAFSLC